MLFSLNVYTFFHVFKALEMEKKRFENKIRKLRHCFHFTKSKTFSIWSFQSLASLGGGGGGVLIRAGCRIFLPKKLSGGDVYSGPKSRLYCFSSKT